MKAAAKFTENDPGWFKELPEKLDAAIGDYDLPSTDDWSPMDEISSQTMFEGVEVHSDSIVREKDKLVAPATIFVELVYDPSSDEPVSFHDSYPARVIFTANKEEKAVTIDRVDIDNSSFFE